MSASRKKILIIRFSSIGDIVLTSPVVRCLKQQLNAEIHFLTKTSYASIVKPNPNIDKVFHIKKEFGSLIKDLTAENYDHIVDLHKNLRSLKVKLSLGRPAITFDKLNYKKWLLTNFKINQLPDIHIVDRYLKAVESLGVKNDGKGLDYFIPKEDQFSLDTILPNKNAFTAFAIGATHATKRLPLEQIIEICKNQKQAIILLGGPTDAAIGEAAAQKCGSNVINQCGKLNVHQSASIIQQSGQVITHDTGMMHIAAAFQKKIISIWGNTVPELGMYPYYPKGINYNQSFEVKDLKCRPCSKIGYASCPKGHFDCMKKQDIDAIRNAI